MSDEQREHSKLYKYNTGKKLDLIPASEFKGGAVPGILIEPGIPVVSSDSQPTSFADFIRSMNCNADAVVSATIKDQSSQLTENREFIFTDYTAQVSEIYKNNLAASIEPSSSIVLTRPGGRVEINGRVVAAIDSSFKLLKTGRQYLLFLKYLPQTSTYQVIRLGSFELNGATLNAMTEDVSLPGSGDDSRSMTSSVRDALNVNCRTH